MSARAGLRAGMRAGIYLSFAGELFEEAEAVAKEGGLTVRELLRQVVESYVASRRLRSVPPTPAKGKGRRSDLLGYGD